MKENTLYVERFRPTELKYYVGNENVKDTIQKYLDQGDNQNFIFYGPAGTGKTTVITQKIAYLIQKELAKPEEILALTFTDKAAAEMQERVDRLVDIGYSELHISTFHSFCQKFIEEYGIDIGLSNKFKLEIFDLFCELILSCSTLLCSSWYFLRTSIIKSGLF